MQSNGGCATGQACAASTGGLKTGQDHHVAMVSHMVGQVVQNTPACGHATGRQNDHRAVSFDQCLGLFWGFDHGGHVVHGFDFGRIETVFAHMALVQGRGVNRHGAVQENWQSMWNGPLLFELRNAVQYCLCATHCKDRHNGHTAACGDLSQSFAQL